MSHSHEYRTSDRFAGRRVLIVGAGNSAAEIAIEVGAVAERTLMSIRGSAHVIPRWVGGAPFDAGDVEPRNRLPWRLLNVTYSRRVARVRGPVPASWPLPARRLLEGIPIISSDLLPAVRRGDVVVKAAIEQLNGERVRFVDGSEEPVDDIVYATGYRISLPFLSSSLLSGKGRALPLYRRITATEVQGLYSGRLRLPAPAQMLRAIERAERRTRQRLPHESPHSVRCDPHACRRLLQSDLGRARRRLWRAATTSETSSVRPRSTPREQPAG